jgi:hypothetical protein
MRRRHWVLLVLAVGGTLLNVEALAATNRQSPQARAAHPASRAWVEAARAYGLYADPADWATPPKIAFSERETLLLTIVALAGIITSPKARPD